MALTVKRLHPLFAAEIGGVDLLAAATQPGFVYRHSWRQFDLVIWDNRAVLHRGCGWDKARYRRVMHRTTVAGERSTLEELMHPA